MKFGGSLLGSKPLGRGQSASSVCVEAPASSANLGPGFDVFALALKRPTDRLRIKLRPSRDLRIDLKVRGASGLPERPAANVVGAVAKAVARDYGIRGQLSLVLEKRVPIGVGLGSSGASSAATAMAMNTLFDIGLKPHELIRYAGVGERLATGAAHLDNVAASLLGGFVLAETETGPGPVCFDAPTRMRLCLVTPIVPLPTRKTEYARSLLPDHVRFSTLVHNVSMATHMVSGFALRDIGMIGHSMDDAAVEPARAKMIPAYGLLKKSALAAGAGGVCISGAGPTVLAVVDATKAKPKAILESMMATLKRTGIRSKGFVTSVGDGARILEFT